MKLTKTINQRIWAVLFLVAIVTSCKVTHAPDRTKSLAPPSTFTGSTDSASIGDIPARSFFTDPYLVKLIDTALQYNPDLHIAMQRIEMARGTLLMRRGALLPSVNATAGAGVERFGDYTMNGVGNFDTNLSPNINSKQQIPSPTTDFFIGFKSYWEIDIWGKLKTRKKAAYTRFLASEKGKHLMTTSLVAEIAKLYYELIALDSKLKIVRQNISVQETGVEIINIQKAGGKVTQLAVEQFTAQLLSTKSHEAEIEQQIVAAENQLNFLLGRFPQPIERAASIHNQKLPAEIKAGIPSAMLLRRPDIQQAELELAATREDQEAARLAFFPSLTLSPAVGLNAFNPSLLINPGSLAYGVFAQLSAPLLNRRMLKADYKITSAARQQALYEYQKAILMGFQEVVTELKGLENYEKVYQLREEQTRVLENAVSTSNDLFLAGYASYLEVITAQKNVLEAELGLIDSRKVQFFTVIDLYRSLGGGWK